MEKKLSVAKCSFCDKNKLSIVETRHVLGDEESEIRRECQLCPGSQRAQRFQRRRKDTPQAAPYLCCGSSEKGPFTVCVYVCVHVHMCSYVSVHVLVCSYV